MANGNPIGGARRLNPWRLMVDPLGGVLSAAFAGLWLVSAALFHRAASQR